MGSGILLSVKLPECSSSRDRRSVPRSSFHFFYPVISRRYDLELSWDRWRSMKRVCLFLGAVLKGTWIAQASDLWSCHEASESISRPCLVGDGRHVCRVWW